MDDESRISQLEKALLDQAETLARERLDNAEATRRHLLDEAGQRLAEAEARERQVVRASADRLVRRRVQAAEGRLTADLDRLRWALTQAAISNVRLALLDLTQDRARYLGVLAGFLSAAAARLPAGDLVAEVNSADLNMLAPGWVDLCARAAPGRSVELADHGRDSLGGVSVRLADNRARLDQTFEARLDRLDEALAAAVMARMFAGPPELGGL
ncbi:V-type ATP synthase subunit E [Parasulfuritortus cantonensis]|uniref:V-type ATP synthase subunit E n=1 Tax=Parasulfuritortus cantonensis TaxID=2528202 RepID=A0A4R1BKY3_9PROT|nr:V-type ATP synthase subunit E family protein [Parasulfuritortus cantonensis]TCJ17999.1 V-type ATP synthase subunit E [Parasulfuritortus cantonensis]